MSAQHDYNHVYKEVKGAFHRGKMRYVDGNLAFRDADKSNSISQWNVEDDITKAVWSRCSQGYELRLYMNNDEIHSFSNFQKADYEKLKEHFPEMIQKNHGVRGWNFGELDVKGKELVFTDPKEDDIFEIPLYNVSNCTQSKNEMSLEFHANDLAPINLMEIRFHTISEVGARTMTDDILEHANVLQARGQAIANFNDLSFQIPRGRYGMKLFDKFMDIRGKSHDYKIAYTSIQRMFCLNHMDGLNFFFVIALDPPIKQGQTRYPYLVMQLPKDDDITMDLHVEDEDEFHKKYQGKLQPSLSGPLFQIFAVVLKHICGKKVHSTGDSFDSKQPCIQCSHKANQGYLYPLETAFVYLIKPPIYIKFVDIDYVHFAPGSSQRKNFEFEIVLKNKEKTKYSFSNIEREEYNPIYKFCQDKNIKVKNAVMGMGQGKRGGNDSGDDTIDPYMQRAMAEGEEDDSESDDEDFDVDMEEKKLKEKGAIGEEYESGSGGSTDLSGTESEDTDDPDVIHMDDEEAPKQKKRSISKKVTTKERKERGSPKKKMKMAKDPNAPKKPAGAYFMWMGEYRAKMKAENPDLVKNVSEFGKQAGVEWKALSEDKQQEYKNKNAELMDEWKEQMKNYTPSAEYAATAKTVAKSNKALKDPNAPKKPMTAFFAFMGDERENIQKDNPGIAHTEIAKKGGEMWKALSAEEKKSYEEKYKTAMVKWKVDNQEYQETDGAKAFQKQARTVDIGKVMKSKSSSKSVSKTKSSSGSKSGSGSKPKSPKSTKTVGGSVKSKEFVSDSSSSEEEKEDKNDKQGKKSKKKEEEESGSSASESDSD